MSNYECILYTNMKFMFVHILTRFTRFTMKLNVHPWWLKTWQRNSEQLSNVSVQLLREPEKAWWQQDVHGQLSLHYLLDRSHLLLSQTASEKMIIIFLHSDVTEAEKCVNRMSQLSLSVRNAVGVDVFLKNAWACCTTTCKQGCCLSFSSWRFCRYTGADEPEICLHPRHDMQERHPHGTSGVLLANITNLLSISITASNPCTLSTDRSLTKFLLYFLSPHFTKLTIPLQLHFYPFSSNLCQIIKGGVGKLFLSSL